MHHHQLARIGLVLLGAGACSESSTDTPGTRPTASNSAFSNVEVAAEASGGFTNPLSGAPLPSGELAFIAHLPETDGAPARAALLRARPGRAPMVLYSGELLSNPIDLDVAADGSSIVVADSMHLGGDGADDGGAVLTFPVDGGEPSAGAVGYVPRAVTVAESGEIYFSGRDPESGAPGVFLLAGDTAVPVYTGAPLVDPSGIAVFADGRVLVADTSYSEGAGARTTSRGAVVLIDQGDATLFASGFETGYPAGLALTTDERMLVVSGQGADSSNLVFLFDTTAPEAEPRIETAFASEHWSSGGLHRAHGSNHFAWCDRAQGGGTVYSIAAN
jgi:hypothetical protein